MAASQSTFNIDQALLRGPEVAAVLGISRALAYRWMQNGTLPTVRVERTVRVPRAALVAWINSSTKAAVPPEASTN